MDEQVLRAMQKWPNVPACFGWLALDVRGQWRLRDDEAQAQHTAGDIIRHAGLIAFIERHYQVEIGGGFAGAWYFQNGPQKVYVDLAYTPWVWRWHAGGAAPLYSHTGLPAQLQQVWLDEDGQLLMQTDVGIGVLHDLDMVQFAEQLVPDATGMVLHCQGQRFQVQTIARRQVAAQFGVVTRPRP